LLVHNGLVRGHLEVALLGPVTVALEGRPAPVAGAPQRTLLARLALDPGRTVSDDALLDALWPGGAPPNASGNLQSYVSRLRRVLGASAVERQPMGYRLAVERDQVDVARFEALADEAHRLVAADDPASASGRFGEALALWRGEPFADVTDPLAFGPERARLAVVHHRTRVGWLAARVASGEADGALADLERAVAEDPTDEAVHLVLVRALHVLGRSGDALRVAADLRRRVVDATGLDPGPALAELEAAVLADDPALRPVARPPTPPPADGAIGGEPPRSPAAPRGPVRRLAPADRFIGRDRELADVRAALGGRRLVTVVGPGGAGKTRLVQEVVDRGDVGETVVVGLAPVGVGEELAARVAGAVGLQAAPEGAEAALVDRLAHRQVTLVLDNCEHVAGAVARLVERVLGAGDGVRVLATSRVRLGVAGEQVLRLGPLAPADQAELFCDRAALQRPGFEPAPADRPVIESICRQLDGLPLGLELAARREGVFGLAQLDAQLADGLQAIEPGDDEGGRGVVAAVGWSYRLLRSGARALFDRLAVCRGGFPLEAVAALAPEATTNPHASLAELVDASLVEVDLAAEPPRYRLLEVMRRVALGHLDADGLAEARRAHRRWVLRHVERCFALQAERDPASSALLRRERSNVVAALSVDDLADLLEVGRLAALVGLLDADDPQLELNEQLRRLEPWAGGDDEAAALCAVGCGAATWLRGDTTRAVPLLDHALEVLPPEHPHRWIGHLCRISSWLFIGDVEAVEADAARVLAGGSAPPWGRATAVCSAALVNTYRGLVERAGWWMDEHAALLDDVGRVDGFTSFTRADVVSATDPERALAWYDDGHRVAVERGQTYNRAINGVGRTSVLVRLGRGAEAAAAGSATIAFAARIGMWPQVWTSVRTLTPLLVAVGEPAAAAVLLTAAAEDPLSSEVLEVDGAILDGVWAAIRLQLAAPEVEEARRVGRHLDRSQAAALAVEVLTRHA
jgi:predicted ATPase/DNA-binding SARP family transcriptional activator